MPLIFHEKYYCKLLFFLTFCFGFVVAFIFLPYGQKGLFKHSEHLGFTGLHIVWPKPTSSLLTSLQCVLFSRFTFYLYTVCLLGTDHKLTLATSLPILFWCCLAILFAFLSNLFDLQYDEHAYRHRFQQPCSMQPSWQYMPFWDQRRATHIVSLLNRVCRHHTCSRVFPLFFLYV